MLFSNAPLEYLVAVAIALLVGLTFHEFSHAFTADTLGDHRPRAMGRLSLNPLRHLDPIGAVMLLIAGFGWAKPVMVNPYALRSGRQGMALVAAAGPLSNVAVALVFGVIARILGLAGVDGGFVFTVVFLVIYLNLVLAIFNLLPIPPLDGYNFALALLPPRLAFPLQRYAPYGVLILLLLVLVPGSPLRWLLQLALPLGRVVAGA
jgi:Zn-dependent protease